MSEVENLKCGSCGHDLFRSRVFTAMGSRNFTRLELQCQGCKEVTRFGPTESNIESRPVSSSQLGEICAGWAGDVRWEDTEEPRAAPEADKG
jgi:hypothetical protein